MRSPAWRLSVGRGGRTQHLVAEVASTLLQWHQDHHPSDDLEEAMAGVRDVLMTRTPAALGPAVFVKSNEHSTAGVLQRAISMEPDMVTLIQGMTTRLQHGSCPSFETLLSDVFITSYRVALVRVLAGLAWRGTASTGPRM